MKLLFLLSLAAYIAVSDSVFTITVLTNCIGPVCPSRPILCTEDCPVNTFYWNECLSGCLKVKSNPPLGTCVTVGEMATLLDEENGADADCPQDNH